MGIADHKIEHIMLGADKVITDVKNGKLKIPSGKNWEFYIGGTKVAVLDSTGRLYVKSITQVGSGNLP